MCNGEEKDVRGTTADMRVGEGGREGRREGGRKGGGRFSWREIRTRTTAPCP